tara:strand:+ start:3684 stop:3827 length:144 start_codon:yes stop_codon:yes gene_type:complete
VDADFGFANLDLEVSVLLVELSEPFAGIQQLFDCMFLVLEHQNLFCR